MAKLTTGATVKIDHAHNVDYCLGEAFRQLKANKGPFVLNMPQDVLHAVLPDEKWTYRPMYKAKVLQPPRPEDVAEAAKILANAKRPTILCGLGAAEGKAEPEVRKLAEYLGAPVATSLYAAGFCAQYPLYLGISGGLGSDLTVDTLAESDALIVVGASLNEWTTHFGKILENGKKIIQIDDRQDAFGWFARIAVGLEADAKGRRGVARSAEGRRPGRPSAGCADRTENQAVEAAGDKLRRREVGRSAARRRLSGRQAAEAGSHSRLRRWPLRNGDCSGDEQPQRRQLGVRTGLRRHWTRLGHRAWRLLCATRQRVTHLTADASFMMNVSDFHTAVSHNLPLTVFVFNDNAVGQERHDLIHKGLPPKYAEVASPDFEKLAVGFGAKGFRVDRPDDFGEIDKALAVQDGPVIVNVRINGDVELPVSWEIAKALENTGE
jgi:acetolactate synthase-1/2/3 large subunit